MPGSDVRVVHLVRDSRAVAYSWTRRRREPSPIAGRQFMPQFSPYETATKWVAWNLGLHLLCTAGLPYVKVAYESFVADPNFELSRIAEIAGEGLDVARANLCDGQVRLGEHHIFSGNPMRTNTGWIALRVDDEWMGRFSRAQFAGVTAITWPMLQRYGYRISRRGRPRSAGSPGRSGEPAERQVLNGPGLSVGFQHQNPVRCTGTSWELAARRRGGLDRLLPDAHPVDEHLRGKMGGGAG